MRRERSKTHAAVREPRPARRIYDEANDPFSRRAKTAEPTLCPGCGAARARGRWTWPSAAAASTPARGGSARRLRAAGVAARAVCPACKRIAEGYPAAVVVGIGDFPPARRREVLALVRHVEERDRAEHPMKRTFGIEATRDGIRVPTTDRRLAKGIAQALRSAFGGTLVLRAAEPPGLAQWTWRAEAPAPRAAAKKRSARRSA